MPFTLIPTTPEGRAVHIAAFELAIKNFAVASPCILTGRQQDAMVQAIIEMIAAGATDLEIVAKHAVQKAKEISHSKI